MGICSGDVNLPPDVGITVISFDGSAPVSDRHIVPLAFNGSAYISDSLGQLFMYSNGCKIMNKGHQLMLEGDSLSTESYFYEGWCSGYTYGLPTLAQVMLPFPSRPQWYAYLHGVPTHSTIMGLIDVGINYTIVDGSRDDGMGAVVEKNKPLIRDTLFDLLDACKHANGKDWWLIACDIEGNGFYKFLFDSSGFRLHDLQHEGPKWQAKPRDSQGDTSPDGSLYMRQNPVNGTDIFHFDRCNGKLKFDKHIPFPRDTLGFSVACFSPNSRYLYYSLVHNIWQIDLWAPDPMQSLVKVGEYDGFKDGPSPTYFFTPTVGPDNKIYISPAGGTRYLHVIHEPDKPGLACDLRQHDFRTATYLTRQFFMNGPNYALGPTAVPCDTSSLDSTSCSAFSVYPNPVKSSEPLSIQSDCSYSQAELFDYLGRLLQTQQNIGAGDQEFILNHGLTTGLYFLRLKEKESTRHKTVKVVVVDE